VKGFEGWEGWGPRCYVALTLTLYRRAGEEIVVVGGSIASILSVSKRGGIGTIVIWYPEKNHL